MGIIETLQAEIQALKKRVERLESKWAREEVEEAPRQLTCDDIIEMAKRDVKELSYEDEKGRYYEVGDIVRCRCVVNFVINRDKRTVVALLKWRYNGKVEARGIAKCHPDDCFNAHIGRAIALRRALGLEVPDEYLNAPQPTEVRVGDVVESYSFKQPKRYVVVGTDKEVDEKDGCCHVNSIIATSFPYRTRIIDDSREEA
jgi:hypothetical protein